MNKYFLLDTPSDTLLFGFDRIKKSIINLLEEREPRYTIGIYGEWGSGKTTLLHSIYHDLLNKNKDKKTISSVFLCGSIHGDTKTRNT